MFEVYPNTRGFCDLSGGFHNRFVMTPEAATPGYLPDALFAGTWSVLLGLHKVAAKANTRMAAVVIGVGVLILVFPFVQRFFVKGITLGAAKE